MKVDITCWVTHTEEAYEVNIPGIAKWDDIEDWHIKHGFLHYTVKGDTKIRKIYLSLTESGFSDTPDEVRIADTAGKVLDHRE